MKTKIITTILLLMISAFIFAGCQVQSEERTINVEGSSELEFEPENAEIWVGVSLVEESADLVQSEVNKRINAIIDGLRYKGVYEKDISTERLNIYEEWDWQEGSRVSIGWRGSQTLKIKTEDLNKIGLIIDIALENGANQINNINFGLSEKKEKEYKNLALANAAENAREKAETIASSLGVNIKGIKTVSESSYNYVPWRYDMVAVAGSEAVKEATAVMPRDISVTAYISVVYLIG